VPDAPESKVPPRVWLVLGDKRGDNAMVEALASALPWPCERRELRPLPQWVLGKPRVRPSLEHLDPDRSDPLEPPWPDLVISVGRRPSMAALWIQKQSGFRTRLVLLGKPSGMMERFDLVIGSAEVLLPPLPNAFRIRLPLLRVDPERVRASVETWRERLGSLPRPLVALLVGGPTRPFVYDASVIEHLIETARRVLKEGGTPYVTTSRRTPEHLVDALESGLPEGSRMFRWQADAEDNPYPALLGLADGFVVTADSISMLVEVARLGRPLSILPLPSGRFGSLDRWRRHVVRWFFTRPHEGPGGALRKALAIAGFRARLLHHTRDFEALHHFLLENGLAVRAGQPFQPPTAKLPDDLGRAAARVEALFG
jgi:mitochondrial fission protein ELM1